jgi:hypothetical protein
MFQSIRDDFKQLRRGKTGRRFRDFYDFRQQQRRPGLSPVRVFNICFGIALVIGGAAIGWLPGPGGFIAIFGLALLAQEFRPMAVLLDWLEPKLRAVWRWLVRTWRRMSSSGRVAVAMTIAITSASMGYAAYSLLLR